MPKELDFENLRLCLDNFKTERVFIRSISNDSTVKVDENLEGKILDAQVISDQLSIFIDGSAVFRFSFKKYERGFSLAYERFDENGVRVFLPTGINPDDPDLPEPKRSILRHDLDDHLIEIYFQGKIPLKSHSFRDKEKIWKYWCVDI